MLMLLGENKRYVECLNRLSEANPHVHNDD